jgi:uncharacterized protein (DUF58 family)
MIGRLRSGGFLPTRRLAVATALLAPLWLLSSSRAGLAAVLLGLTVLLLAVVVDALLLPLARDVRVQRTLPETTGLGDPAEGVYEITAARHGVAPWAEGTRFTLAHAPPPEVELSLSDRRPFALRAAEATVRPITVVGRARGRHHLGPVVLRATGSLGLIQRSLEYPLGDRITVAPSLAGIRRYRLLALQHRLRDMGVRAVRRRGEGTTFDTLREYVAGDEPRHVDWKASARRGTLITRQYTVEQGQTILIAIDSGRLMTQLAGPVSRFEQALSAALILADVAVGSGDRVGCMVFDDEPRVFVSAARGRAALAAIRAALIPVTPSMVEPDYAAAFRTLAARNRKRSLIVLFSDVIDPRASHALIAHTSRSATRHLPLVVALRNDELAQAAVPSPDASSTRVYESAAAEELLSAREEALQKMRRAGVSVLDVSPRQMSAAVVNRYLEIKARASL